MTRKKVKINDNKLTAIQEQLLFYFATTPHSLKIFLFDYVDILLQWMIYLIYVNALSYIEINVVNFLIHLV